MMTINGGAGNFTGVTFVGVGGSGTLTVENGGTLTSGSTTIAENSGSSGTATVTGTGSSWTNVNFTVGQSAQGTLTISNGGLVTSGGNDLAIGSESGSAGSSVLINAGTLNLTSNGLQIAGGANASMTVENGGQVMTAGAGILIIGPDGSPGSATGTLTVTGAGSSAAFSTSLVEIGNTSTSTGIMIQNGASFTGGETLIGGFVSNAVNNAVVVTGAGSTWQSGAILLGNVEDVGPGAGTGTMSVLNGAHASATGNIDVGYSPDGGSGRTDTITVDGSGSQLTTSTGNLRVGFYGTGVLTVTNGATVTDVEGDIAYSSTNTTAAQNQFSGATTPTNSVGSATVDGAGSVWQNTTLIVGDNTSSPGAGYGTGTSTGTLTISNGGEVISTNAIMVGANAGATGTINIGAAAGQTAVAPGTISAPAIVFGAGTGSIVFNHTSTGYAFGVPIQGPGSVIVDGGTTIFTATNTYTGPTTINGGTLDVAGSITASSSVTVNSGGTLTGAGTVDPATVAINSGGTFAPGTPGTPGAAMTITGNLAFQSGALYVIYLNPSSNTKANVAGTASLAGMVEAVFAPGTYVSKSYDILHSSGLGGTTFGGVTTVPPNFDASLSYTATDVFLNLTAQLGQSTTLNVNQQNVANAINNFFNGGGVLPPEFLSLFGLSGASLPNALTQLDGEDATGAERGAFQLMNEFLGLLLDPFVYGSAGPGGQPLGFAPDRDASLPPDVALAYAGVFKAPPKPTFQQRWTAWGAGFGGSNQTNGDPAIGSSNVTTSTYGYAGGMDYHYSPDTVVGFALAGGGTNWGLAQGLGTGRSDAALAGVYGATHAGPAYLAAALTFANNWFTTNRAALGDQLAASFQGQSYGARLEGGYRFAVPAYHGLVGLTPYAAIQAQDFHTPSYSETDLSGGGFGLSYNAMTGTDTRSELGGRFDDLTALGTMPLMLRAKVAWAHDWVSNPALNASFESLPGTSFTVFGAAIPHDSALASAGGELFFTPSWSLIGKFDGEFASGSQTYAGTGTLRYTW